VRPLCVFTAFEMYYNCYRSGLYSHETPQTCWYLL